MERRKKPATSTGFYQHQQRLLAFFDVFYQTLTFTHLRRRQRIAFVRKRVFPFFELNADRRPHHIQRLTEIVHQITLVGIRQVFDLVAVNHHDWWVITTGVGIFQLHTTTTHQRRLMIFCRHSHNARQHRGADATGGNCHTLRGPIQTDYPRRCRAAQR